MKMKPAQGAVKRRGMAGHSAPIDAALDDVGTHRRLRFLPLPRAASFLEYVQAAADMYRDARLGDDISRN